MQIALFHNRNAGYGPHTRETLVRLLRDAGYEPVYFDLHRALDNPRALATGAFVVAAGGDGSIRKVALKLFNSGRALAPLPIGTANNIARGLGLGGSPEKIIAGWGKSKRRRMDVGFVTGPWGKRYFLEGVGLGLMPRSSRIIGELDDVSARDFNSAEDRLHRNRCVIAALAHEVRPFQVKLSVEGRNASDNFLLLEAMNIDRVGPGIQLAPQADPHDGYLDLVAVTSRERSLLQRKMKDRLAGPLHAGKLKTTRCRMLSLVVGRCDLLVDDQLLPITRRTKIGIGVLPEALELVVPAKPPTRRAS